MEGGRGCFRSFVARFVFIPPLPKLSTWPLDTRALAFLIPIRDSTYWSVYFEKSSRRSLFYSPIRCLHQGVFENSVLDLNSSEKGIIIGYFHLCEVLVLFTLGWIWLRWFIVCFFALLYGFPHLSRLFSRWPGDFPFGNLLKLKIILTFPRVFLKLTGS